VLPEVPAGAHKIRIRLAGFRPFEEDVVVEPKGSVQVRAELRPLQEVTAASRTTESVEDAPASVTLISREEIRAFGYQTLYEALGGTRGVFQTNDRTYEAVGFRGFSRPGEDYGDRVLVTLDGHAMNDDQLGSSYVGYDFRSDLLDVDRIEVVRGPGSALYGTNAFFGVVNVVTRDGRDVPSPQVSVATDDERRVRLHVGGGFGDEHAGAWAGAGGVKPQGGDLYLPDVAPATSGGVLRDVDEMQSGWVGGKAWLGDLTLQVDLNHREKRIPTGAFDTLPGDHRATSTDTRGFAELRYEPSLGKDDRLYLRAYLDWYRFRGGYPYDDPTVGVVRDSWDGLWAGGEARVLLTPFDRLRLTLGGEGRTELKADLKSMDASGTYLDHDARFQVYSGYGVADLRPLDWLTLSGGARVDHFSTFGTAVSPRAAIVARPWTDGVLKLMGGRAFRAPSPYELSYNDDGVTQIAADDLQPETIDTAEVEYTHRLARTATLTGSVFYNEIRDLIVVGEPTPDIAQYRNLDERVHTAGAEIEVRREWRERWMVAASYSFQRTRVGSLADGDRLSNSPAHAFALKGAVPVTRGGPVLAQRLRVEAPRLDREGNATDTALLWDVTLTGDLPTWHLEYGVGVRNLLDWRVAHPVGGDLAPLTVPQPGRTLFATATLAY
jgi:outer membrane receptor protein involved in Fe transport